MKKTYLFGALAIFALAIGVTALWNETRVKAASEVQKKWPQAEQPGGDTAVGDLDPIPGDQMGRMIVDSSGDDPTTGATDQPPVGQMDGRQMPPRGGDPTAWGAGQPPGGPTGGMKMKPMTAPELTADQTAQLAAGEADHATTTLNFDVHGGMFYFVPNVIKVKKGDTVKINYINDGGHHDFNLDEFGFKIDALDGGHTSSGQFVADKVGSFEYYCSIGSHRKMGQRGTLVVTE